MRWALYSQNVELKRNGQNYIFVVKEMCDDYFRKIN